MRIVLFERNGQIRWEFQRILPLLGQVIALDYDDLANLNTLQPRLDEHKLDMIVTTSAYTVVDRAESERNLAKKFNGRRPVSCREQPTDPVRC